MPSFKAVSKAASSIRPPRAQLMRRTPGFIFMKASLLRSLAVSLVFGVWMVMKSERARSSSRETSSAPILAANSLVMKGS